MKTLLQFALLLPVSALGLTACVSPERAAHSAKGQLLQDAGKYVEDLKKQDKLPGCNGTEHGHLIASAPWKGGQVVYPAPVTVRLWKEGDETVYCYDLLKDSPQSVWQLAAATHLDKHDKLIGQLYPK